MTQNAFFKKNSIRKEFKGLKSNIVVALWITLLIVGFFLFTNEVLGATIIEDDFEAYDTGTELGASEEWWCNYSSGNQPTISEDTSWSGLKSVKNKYVNNPADSLCVRVGNNTPEGSQRVWFYIGTTFTGIAEFQLYGSIVAIKFENDLIKYLDATHSWQTLAIFDEYDEWVQFEIEWKATSESSVRYSYNGGDWTNWENHGIGHWFGEVRVMWSSQQFSGSFYFDSIEEAPSPCEIGNCSACEIYDTCIEAGCYWYYWIYSQTYFCVEPFEPEPEDCGPFYKCQYCLNQETCEEEKIGFCEWVDRGLGERCYMVEPTIPPVQEEWEIPDLETCEGLGTIETWLCEIKNFIAGAFMPSQEKVNSLYQTFGAFKEKFPFNYAESLNRFFDDVGESLDEEKGIPISVLGQESNVSFVFWEEETTIGGIQETLKNVLFDFTTFIVLIGWFVWLISWIKRFF